jgi:hypothetical protein
VSLEKKLRFLYEHGREEQVGAYFRNQNLTDVTPENSFGKFFWDFVTLDLGEEGLQDSVSHVNGGHLATISTPGEGR